MPEDCFITTAHLQAAVVIPVHNEEACLAPCLTAACAAADAIANLATSSKVVVVLDRCTDRSAAIVSQFPFEIIVGYVGSVGAARSLGAEHAMQLGATWPAFTDADTLVSTDWLAAQLSLNADVVCGTVAISDWYPHDPLVRAARRCIYRCGWTSPHPRRQSGSFKDAYLACGGFKSLTADEDIELVTRLVELQLQVEWSAIPRVSSSARPANRVDGGFGSFIRNVVKLVFAENAREGTLTASSDVPVPTFLSKTCQSAHLSF